MYSQLQVYCNDNAKLELNNKLFNFCMHCLYHSYLHKIYFLVHTVISYFVI